MAMQTRTWQYGTVKEVRVDDIFTKGKCQVLVCIEPATGEGFILLEGVETYPDIKPGNVGWITFKQGGPTGGFWAFSAIKPS